VGRSLGVGVGVDVEDGGSDVVGGSAVTEPVGDGGVDVGCEVGDGVDAVGDAFPDEGLVVKPGTLGALEAGGWMPDVVDGPAGRRCTWLSVALGEPDFAEDEEFDPDGSRVIGESGATPVDDVDAGAGTPVGSPDDGLAKRYGLEVRLMMVTTVVTSAEIATRRGAEARSRTARHFRRKGETTGSASGSCSLRTTSYQTIGTLACLAGPRC
jgi:hypothetical protein